MMHELKEYSYIRSRWMYKYAYDIQLHILYYEVQGAYQISTNKNKYSYISIPPIYAPSISTKIKNNKFQFKDMICTICIFTIYSYRLYKLKLSKIKLLLLNYYTV